MQLKKSTGHAIRIILVLDYQKKATVPEIAKLLNVKVSYVKKLITKLKEEGYVSSKNGYGGGFELAKKLNDITLWDIINSTEETTKINFCLEENHACSQNVVGGCKVRNVFFDIQKELEDGFSKYTFQDILQNEQEKMKIRL